MRICILGNGIAGVSVAQELRKREPDPSVASVEIYSREPYHYYSRIRLPEVIAPGLGPDRIRLYKDEWYDSRGISVRLGEKAIFIDRMRQIVGFESGLKVGYDKLVLALGADASRPPIPGFDLPGVFTLREYHDAAALRESLLSKNGGAAVIGGGLLGLEAARRMRETGAKGAGFELFPRLLPRQLDSDGAAILKSVLERMGLEIILSAETASLGGEDRVRGIRLKDGRSSPAETVLLSMGIKPAIAIARDAELAVGRGIRVDSWLKTSDPDIYAVGDCAEFSGIVWGIIPAAIEQAGPCAASILGLSGPAYVQTVPKNTLKVADIDLTSIGEVLADGSRGGVEEALVKSWAGTDRYEKYVLEEGRLVGSILLGSKANVNWSLANIGKPTSRADVERRLSMD
jgi:nitrite reductase (NADH) large subunit